MINESDPLLEDFHVKTRGSVAGLVCIHGDARGEKHSWNTVVDKDSLVRKPVEHSGESLAAVVTQAKVQIYVVQAVACFQIHSLVFGKRVVAQHYQVILPVAAYR